MRRAHPLLSCILITLMAMTSGCESPRFSAVTCPSDKALVYVYWGHWIVHLDTVEIYVNKQKASHLHTGGYHPFLLDPGPVTFGWFQSAPLWAPMSTLPVHDANALTLTLEAGKTYYLAYNRYGIGGFTQVDASIAKNKIKNYTLSK
jgi:hypothetical protein